MAQVVHTQEIAEHIRSLLWNNFQSSLSLITCQEGDIAFLAAEENFANMLPAIFMRPAPTDLKPRVLSLNQEILYRYNIVYIKKVTTSQNVVKVKTQEINSIAELLFAHRLLPGLTLTNGRIIYCLPTSINYEPPEDGFLAARGMADVVAASISISVLHYTSTF